MVIWRQRDTREAIGAEMLYLKGEGKKQMLNSAIFRCLVSQINRLHQFTAECSINLSLVIILLISPFCNSMSTSIKISHSLAIRAYLNRCVPGMTRGLQSQREIHPWCIMRNANRGCALITAPDPCSAKKGHEQSPETITTHSLVSCLLRFSVIFSRLQYLGGESTQSTGLSYA